MNNHQSSNTTMLMSPQIQTKTLTQVSLIQTTD